MLWSLGLLNPSRPLRSQASYLLLHVLHTLLCVHYFWCTPSTLWVYSTFILQVDVGGFVLLLPLRWECSRNVVKFILNKSSLCQAPLSHLSLLQKLTLSSLLPQWCMQGFGLLCRWCEPSFISGSWSSCLKPTLFNILSFMLLSFHWGNNYQSTQGCSLDSLLIQ